MCSAWCPVHSEPAAEALLTWALAVSSLDNEFLHNRHCVFSFVISQVLSTSPMHQMNKWMMNEWDPQSKIAVWLILWHTYRSYLTGILERLPFNISFPFHCFSALKKLSCFYVLLYKLSFTVPCVNLFSLFFALRNSLILKTNWKEKEKISEIYSIFC